MYVLQEPKDFSFVKVGIKGKIFITDLTKNVEFAIIRTETGHETTIIEHECDFIYYVLEGSGHFEINSKKENFKRGNLVVVPMGNHFTYKGKATFLLITSPLFRPEQEETL